MRGRHDDDDEEDDDDADDLSAYRGSPTIQYAVESACDEATPLLRDLSDGHEKPIVPV